IPSRRRGERRGVSKRQGHFQGRARQLTSSAFGRASSSPVTFTGVRPQTETEARLEPAVCIVMTDTKERLLLLTIQIFELPTWWPFARTFGFRNSPSALTLPPLTLHALFAHDRQ